MAVFNEKSKEHYGKGVWSSPYTPQVRQTFADEYASGENIVAFKVPKGAIVRSFVVKGFNPKTSATIALNWVTKATDDWSAATLKAVTGAETVPLNTSTFVSVAGTDGFVTNDTTYVAVTTKAKITKDTKFEVIAICDFTERLPIEW